ncbi:hypothetical protein [Rivihabitans pingtungensis]|uniref:Carboxypeptidase family protein n=1 Tax=Rivihabitans pingtungensis TaxID=1054498 RepID=A0A318KK24_9NEIS|nr:hypothetical protein [Rivihabitans pingtungensis]PXX75151.1 hypothetical protein DFR34_1274 [Rivihabitans pingtungensis]
MSESKEPVVLSNAPATLTSAKPRSMKGRALDKKGEPIKGASFIIYAGKPVEGYKNLPIHPVVAGKTDATGNFSISVPAESYKFAYATLSIAPDSKLEIVLVDGVLPEFTLLVLDVAQADIVPEHDGCGCQDKPGRLPEMEDLLSPDSIYQQDIGGSCVNFTTPNRALEEFAFTTVVRTTDPEIMNAPGYLGNLGLRIRTLQKAIEDAKKPKPKVEPEPEIKTSVWLSGLAEIKANLSNYNTVPTFVARLSYWSKQSKVSSGWTFGNQITDVETRLRLNQNTSIANELEGLIKTEKARLEAQGKPTASTLQALPVSPASDTRQLLDLEWMSRELARLEAERAYVTAQQNQLMKRRTVSMANPIQWDSPLPLVQSASICHGHILNFRQVWRADGYSMGDLLYSLPLAPGQKKQIVIHDWERRETASRSENQLAEDSLSNTLTQDRDINDIVDATLHEMSEGHSKVKTKGSAAGFGMGSQTAVDAPIDPKISISAKVGYSGGLSASRGQSESWASQSSSRDISSSALQSIRDKTTQHASAIRSQRTTVVTSMSQSETTTVQSESVANYNHCHAITIEYFEVLRHLAVHTELVDVQECLFIPLTLSFFDDAKVIRWADLLRYALRAPRSQYARLVRGFDALRRYYDVNALGKSQADVYYNVPAGRYCDEPVLEIAGQFTLTVHFACPKKIQKPMDDQHAQVLSKIGDSWFGQPGVAAALGQAHEDWLRDLLIDQQADQQNWQNRLGFIKEIEDIRLKVNKAPDAQRELVFQIELARVNAVGQFAKCLRLRMTTGATVNLDARITLTRAGDNKRAKMSGSVPAFDFAFRSISGRLAVQRDDILHFGLALEWANLPEGSVVNLERLSAQYESRYVNTRLLLAAPNDDLCAGASMSPTPMQDFELVSPRQEDLQLRGELLDHLNTNMEYYHKAIWAQMDPDRRLLLLEGFDIEVPTENPNYTPGGAEPRLLSPTPRRSVASVVENRLIGIVGNTLVMPVAKGLNLDPVYRFASDSIEVDGKPVSRLMAHYMPEKGFRDTPFRISLPTKGVFAEAVMGACNSCEKIDNSRFWKWEEHPIPDNPTAIEPVSTDSRRAEPANLQAAQLAQSLLSQQEGKTLPDPTGLANALALLGKSDLFNDITGLAGNQTNALEALKTNTEAAKHYADLAADLAKTAQVTKHGDDFANSVRSNITDPKKQQEILEQYYKAAGSASQGTAADNVLSDVAKDLLSSVSHADKGKAKVQLPDGTSVETEHERLGEVEVEPVVVNGEDSGSEFLPAVGWSEIGREPSSFASADIPESFDRGYV